MKFTKGDTAYWKTNGGVVYKVIVSSVNEKYAIIKGADHFVGSNRKVKLENLFKKPPKEWFKQKEIVEKQIKDMQLELGERGID